MALLKYAIYAIIALQIIGLYYYTNKCRPSHSEKQYVRMMTMPQRVNYRQTRHSVNCMPDVPCAYPEEVDLRVIVLAYNRHQSLSKCLESLQNVHLDGATAMMEIWLDRDRDGHDHAATVEVALRYVWKLGEVRVHIWPRHVGIYGQWIDTWRPRVGSREIAVFLEDDVDVSPYFYRWLRAAHRFYKHRNDTADFVLSTEDVRVSGGARLGHPLHTGTNMTVYHYRILESWGFSPVPQHWRGFQDWFHETQRTAPKYKPYTPQAAQETSWYKLFERGHRADSMWTMWYIHYCDLKGLYSLHPNIKNMACCKGKQLAVNRKEKGLHYSSPSRPVNSSKHYLHIWTDKLINFPTHPVKYGYKGEKETSRPTVLHPNATIARN